MLLIVLWALVLAALIAAQVTALGRRETLIAANLRTADVAAAAADGAVEEAVFRLMRHEAGWDPDGTPHSLAIGQARVVVTITDESGKLNINTAPLDQIVAVLVSVGVPDDQAPSLAAAITAWRGDGIGGDMRGALIQSYRGAGLDYAPPFQPFETPDELRLVLGMTPDLYARLAPRISIYSGATQGIVTIDARATDVRGGSFARHAVVRLSGPDGYSLLSWGHQ